MYVENDALFTFTKLSYGASKKLFPLVYKAMRVMRKISFYLGRIYLDYRWLSFRLAFLVVSAGSHWLSLVIAGYPWLPLVTLCSFYLAATAEDFCK